MINGEIMNFTVYRKKFQDDLAIAGWSVVLASMSPLYRLKLCHAEKLFHWTKMKESTFGTSRQGECEQYVDRHTCWHKMKNFGRKNCHRQWNSFWSEEKIPWQTEAQEMFFYHKWQVRILAVNLMFIASHADVLRVSSRVPATREKPLRTSAWKAIMFIIWEVWKSPVGFSQWTSCKSCLGGWAL